MWRYTAVRVRLGNKTGRWEKRGGPHPGGPAPPIVSRVVHAVYTWVWFGVENVSPRGLRVSPIPGGKLSNSTPEQRTKEEASFCLLFILR